MAVKLGDLASEWSLQKLEMKREGEGIDFLVGEEIGVMMILKLNVSIVMVMVTGRELAQGKETRENATTVVILATKLVHAQRQKEEGVALEDVVAALGAGVGVGAGAGAQEEVAAHVAPIALVVLEALAEAHVVQAEVQEEAPVAQAEAPAEAEVLVEAEAQLTVATMPTATARQRAPQKAPKTTERGELKNFLCSLSSPLYYFLLFFMNNV